MKALKTLVALAVLIASLSLVIAGQMHDGPSGFAPCCLDWRASLALFMVVQPGLYPCRPDAKNAGRRKRSGLPMEK